GSIRMPAGNCGIVGLKPTYGWVSRRGIYPLSFSLDHVGPMTWNVEDCAMMLQAIAGHDPNDPGSVGLPVPDFSSRLGEPLVGLRIGLARKWYEAEATDGMATAMESVVSVLRDLGADVFDVTMPDLADLNAC